MKCVISNYIPHKTPKKPNYQMWLERYRNDLIQLYDTYKEIIYQRYDDETDRYSDIEFVKFSKFIFACSSQYIQDE